MTSDSESEWDVIPTVRVTGETAEQLANAVCMLWVPKLQTHSYRSGQNLIAFESLWPDSRNLKKCVHEFGKSKSSRIALECCRWALTCGPVRLLRYLIDCQLVTPDQVVQPGGATMLHVSCACRNNDAVRLLLDRLGSANLKKDDKGRTPRDVCYSPTIRQMMSKWQLNFLRKTNNAEKQVTKDVRLKVFELASQPQQLYHLQILLQETNFDVNAEKSRHGDFLVHTLARAGISQIPLLIFLHNNRNLKVDQFDQNGATPLCIVAREGTPAMADVLICLLGADVNLPNCQTGRTPLHEACYHNNIQVLKCLLCRGASCNIEDNEAQLPEFLAKQEGLEHCRKVVIETRHSNAEEVTSLITEGLLLPGYIHDSDQYVVNACGYTPLMVAVRRNKVELINYLGNLRNSPLNAQHLKTGQTALSMSAESGNVECLKQLLDIIAARGGSLLYEAFRIKDFSEHRWLPLHYACHKNHVECVQLLLDQKEGLVGLSVARNLTTNEDLLLMLEEAIQRRQCEIVECTLFEAASNRIKFDELVSLDLEEDDNLNPFNEGESTPVFLSAKNGLLEVVRYLYKPHIEIPFATYDQSCEQESIQQKTSTPATYQMTCPNLKSGWTPLHVAACYGHLDVVEFLLQFYCSQQEELIEFHQEAGNQNGVTLKNIDVEAMKGETALELAVAEGHINVVKALLKNGASATKPDSSGKLLSCKQFPGVQLLLEKSKHKQMMRISTVITSRTANVEELQHLWKPPYDHNLRDGNGKSPLMLCCERGNEQFLQFLLQSVALFEPSEDFMKEFLEVCEVDEDSTQQKQQAYAIKHSSLPPPSQSSYRQRPSLAFQQRPTSAFQPSLKRRHTVAYDNALSPDYHDHWQRPCSTTPYCPTTSTRSLTLLRAPTPLPAMLADEETDAGELYHSLESMSFQGHYLLAFNTENGKSALHYAVESKRLQIVAQVLKVDQRSVCLRDKDGRTPLHIACSLNNTAIVKELLKYPLTNPCLYDCTTCRPDDLTSKPTIKQKIIAAREEFKQRTMEVKLSSGSDMNDMLVEGILEETPLRSNDRRSGELGLMLKYPHRNMPMPRKEDHNGQFYHILDSLPSAPSHKEQDETSSRDYQQTLQASSGTDQLPDISFSDIQVRLQQLKAKTGTRHYCPPLHDAEQVNY